MSTQEDIGIVQGPGFGSVAIAQINEYKIRSMGVRTKTPSPGNRQWWVVDCVEDVLEGKTEYSREVQTKTEKAAFALLKEWQREWAADKKRYFDALQKLTDAPKPKPPNCHALSKFDLKDAAEARLTALRRLWPRCFAIFDRRKSGDAVAEKEWRDAYLTDRIEQGNKPNPESEAIRVDMNLIHALSRADDNHSKRRKSNTTSLALYLIAFNWLLGWCYLSDAEISRRLQRLLKIAFTAKQVKHYRVDTLKLVAMHKPGPSQKVS
jgi:hypothetical protein